MATLRALGPDVGARASDKGVIEAWIRFQNGDSYDGTFFVFKQESFAP